MSTEVEGMEGDFGSEEKTRRPSLYTSEVSEMFDQAKAYLDSKRDKDEEVIRFSKDITWESKKVIYTLHRYFINQNVLKEAKRKIKFLLESERYFLGLSKALEGEDMSLHYRRYTHCKSKSGVQEYIEAVVFLSFLEHRRIPKYEEVRDTLTWEVPDDSYMKVEMDSNITEQDVILKAQNQSMKKLFVPLSVNDYVLGVCDFTGELMKAAVPTLTRPQWHSFLCQSFSLVREIYAQFLGVFVIHNEFRKKMNVMRASVMKIEATVYRLKIKILVYGRLPDSKDLQMIEQDSLLNSTLKTSSDNNFSGNSGNTKSNDDYPHDSGVE